MRLKVLIPVTLAALTGAAILVPAGALVSLTQARGSIEEHMPRLGLLLSLSVASALLAFAGACLLLYRRLIEPAEALAREARMMAQLQQNRPLPVPPGHPLCDLADGIAALGQRVGSARTQTMAEIAAATHVAEEQKSRLEAILLDLTEGVIVCNLEHRILLYNQAAARILGSRHSLGLGRTLFGVLTREPVLHTLEQRFHVVLHVCLAGLQRQRFVHESSHRDLVVESAVNARD